MLFGPFDLPAVIGDPSKRRDLMDEALVALWPLRDTLSSGYDKVLRQRNRLLKEWRAAGVVLLSSRPGTRSDPGGRPADGGARRAVARLEPGASTEFEALSGYELIVSYAPNVVGEGSVEERFRTQLAARRADELVRRTSLVGPHRDDLTLAVRDLGARAFGSHGETGRGTVPPARDRGGGGRRGGGAAAPARRRSVQRARPPPSGSDRAAAAARPGQVMMVADEADAVGFVRDVGRPPAT